MTSDLTSATLITLVSLCMLPLTAILVASEAMAASKRPPRSHLTSELNSVTSITYVPMSLRPLTASSDSIFRGKEAKRHPLTCVASPQVKTRVTNANAT